MGWFNKPFSYYRQASFRPTRSLREEWGLALRDPAYVGSFLFVIAILVWALANYL